MRILFSLIFFVLSASLAQADSHLDRPASADTLSVTAKRFVQAMLVAQGAYDGALDGQWNRRSQMALQQVVENRFNLPHPTLRSLAVLARDFQASLAGGRWEPYLAEQANMSYLLPRTVVGQYPADGEIMFTDDKRQLIVRTRIGPMEEAEKLHQWAIDNANQAGTTTRKRSGDRLVTAAVLRDQATTVYVRSERRGNDFSTSLVQWLPQQAVVARLIIASIKMGAQQPLQIPEDGRLERAILTLDGDAPPPRDKPDTDGPGLAANGFVATGFYINNTDILTSQGLVDDCQLQLADGTELSRIKRAQPEGVAVWTSASRSSHWLTFDANAVAEQGMQVAAVSTPRRDRGEADLISTTGHVAGETVIGDDGLRLLLSMQRRGRILGAPVFDPLGRLVGVVVVRSDFQRNQDDDWAAHLAPARAVTDMLKRDRIVYDVSARRHAGNKNRDFQAEITGAIVPLFCK